MLKRNVFLNISPLDHRYYLSNREVFDSLELYLSETAAIRYCIRVEIALLKSRLEDDTLKSEVDALEEKITPEEVYREEERTRHNVRALVNVMKRKVPQEVKHLVHLGATSADILDTAASLRYKDAVRNVILPLLCDVEQKLIEISEREAETPQIGRTHGQHAIPLTFGFALAEYVSRLGKSILRIEKKSKNLCGKLAGAVGAYNALCLLTKDPEQLEYDFLHLLGLKPSEHSTQLVEPENLLEMLIELNTAFGVIANLADDLRNLQRTEIGEVREGFKKNQVGSSTMPQKRNPWNAEHVKSLWKAFSPRVISFFVDQISEHQRDLTNSASSRFIASYIAGLAAAANRMKSVLASLSVEKQRMLENLTKSGDMVLSEAAYILLAQSGEMDAHEKIKRVTFKCEANGHSLFENLKEDSEIWSRIASEVKRIMNIEPEQFFMHPEVYIGKASEKAKNIARKYKKLIAQVKEVTP